MENLKNVIENAPVVENVVIELTAKELIKATEKRILEAKKQVKKLESIKEKELKEKLNLEFKAAKEKLSNKWLLDTKGLNSLCVYANDIKNSKLMDSYLNKFNKKNNTTFEVKNINKGLFTGFAYSHESNELDLDGKVLSRKSLFNLNFLVDTLLTRKAKFSTHTNVKFIETSKKATEKHLLTRYENTVNSFKLIYDKDTKELLHDFTNEVNKVISDLIEVNPAITNQQIANELRVYDFIGGTL